MYAKKTKNIPDGAVSETGVVLDVSNTDGNEGQSALDTASDEDITVAAADKLIAAIDANSIVSDEHTYHMPYWSLEAGYFNFKRTWHLILTNLT